MMNFVITRSFSFREGSTINVNVLAVCAAISICWLLSEGLRRKDFWVVVFLGLFCVFSGTKKSLIAILLGVVSYIFIKKPTKFMRNIIIAVLLIFIGYEAIMKVPFLYSMIGYRFESLFMFRNGGVGSGSEITRQKFILMGMEYFWEKPIWGHGLDTFRTLEYSYGTYSHNNYVELLFGVGIVGTIAYYSMHISVLLKSIKERFVNNHTNIVLAISFICITLVSDYAMVSYFERTLLVMIGIITMLYRDGCEYVENWREE